MKKKQNITTDISYAAASTTTTNNNNLRRLAVTQTPVKVHQLTVSKNHNKMVILVSLSTHILTLDGYVILKL